MLLYGFQSCDMVRNAKKWLETNKFTYTFIDYRRVALDELTIDDWFARAGWEAVFNRNSTAFKALSASEQAALTASSARSLILANTNFIKRPLLDTRARILTGFNATQWTEALL